MPGKNKNKKKKTKSIKSLAVTAMLPVILAAGVILVSQIYISNGYSKNMASYTSRYFELVNMSHAIDNIKICVGECRQFGVEDTQKKLDTWYSNFSSVYHQLYSNRYSYSDNIRSAIEDMYDYVDLVGHDMEDVVKLTDEEKINETLDNIDSCASRLAAKVTFITFTTAENGEEVYRQLEAKVNIVKLISVISFLCLIACVFYYVYFIRVRILKPINDVCEWSRLFEEGYCDMADLKYKREDEIGLTLKAFNTVKDKLKHANELMEEYKDTTEKLKLEEENKKNFAKQLYVEKRNNEAISAEAKRDGLTGLFNRRTFDEIVDEFVRHKDESGAEGALYLIDMDKFKNVNDTLGHLAGDEALKTLAGAMRVVFSGAAYLGRYGGDEFTVFLAAYKDAAELEELAQALCNKMNMKFEKDGKSVNLSVSVGIATTVGVSEYSELYMRADKALYYSKENGRNQYKMMSK